MTQRPEQFERDLTAELSFPTLSWSSVNSFVSYGKDEWYESYVLGKRLPPNNAMRIGIEIGERIVRDQSYLPAIERPEIFEDNLTAFMNGIKLTGHLDGHSPSVPAIDEYKTSTNPRTWTQKKVDSWGQLTFYTLLCYLNFKTRPEDIRLRLYFIHVTQEVDFTYTESPVVVFNTKRTMADISVFMVYLKKIHTEMREYVRERELSPDCC